METKGKVRSFADIFGEDAVPDPKQQAGVTEIEISKLVPFANHPFKLYEGERFNDMVTSIKELGVVLPVVIRPKGEDKYEILSGHNRVNAAKIAGLEKVPAIIKEGLSDEEANLIVTETNLLQRSFADLSYSERAIALATHYNAIKQQGKRNDLINEIEMLSKPHGFRAETTTSQVGARLRSDEKIGEQYNLSKNTVARYLRLNELIPELLARVDNEEIAFIPAVALSFIKKTEQTGEYFCSILGGIKDKEKFMVAFLDNGNNIIETRTVSEGSLGEAVVYPRNILKAALDCDCKSMVLAHNHPGGSLKASPQDMDVTERLVSIFKPLDINVLDHIIVAGTRYYSMAEQGHMPIASAAKATYQPIALGKEDAAKEDVSEYVNEAIHEEDGEWEME